MSIVEFLAILLVYVFGTLISLVITGLMINKFVIKRVMENKDIKDIIQLIKDAKDALIEANKNHEH